MKQKVVRTSRLFGGLLYLFGIYTLTIKYFLPMGWALQQRDPLTTYIYFWDAWWVAHWWIGYGLRNRQNGFYWRGAMLLTVAEILIIGFKFYLFIPNPNWEFWHLNWFVNKSLMIVFFTGMFFWLIQKEVRDGFKEG